MKRISNLYEKIISIENLKLADEKARKGKKNNYGVRIHDRNREENILQLHKMLKNKTYKTSKYDIFTIYEPKERIIYRLPYYPDRIVHHAIINILEPILLKLFTYNTYSCIKKRGIEGCAKQVNKIINNYKDKSLYCLKIDIKKFYPSINHQVLKTIIRKKIKDKDLLWLLDEIIDSVDGLPIGNYTSQYFANLVMTYFLHRINEVYKIDCVEYADDFVFFHSNKNELKKVFICFIKPYIEYELKLKVKDNWQIFPIAINRYDKKGRALDYVGYKFYRKQKLIRKNIKQNFCRKVSALNKLENISKDNYKQQIAAWLGWAKHSNSKHLLQTIIKKEFYEKSYL